jgi:hypothetical protein
MVIDPFLFLLAFVAAVGVLAWVRFWPAFKAYFRKYKERSAWQFSLQSLLVAMTVICIALVFISIRLKRN